MRRAVRDIAGELVVLYRRRLATPGHAFAADGPFQTQIEESFPYEETPDQAQAIIETKADMERPIPMDRLVCGDVGYGKTEVALRAAAKAVFDGKQVAILVPTTLLASQHGQTFRERFANYPVRVEVLSRFLSAKEQTEVVRGVKDGTVDIVVGTHRLLSDDMQFKDLGLLVVDEEQRFGVQHKERIKGMRTSVDILTLTATPIPRTLEMSLTGIRDLSLVNTPPEDRQPILTYVGEHDPRAVSEAIRRELLREGQVLYVHNRVKDIEHVAADVRELVPEARVAVAHGQMDEGRLERVVQKFWEHEFDVLVCTTIVESGLDMPTVNTLVVDRADRLGLAQLYQLRGRVGRRGQRAYAYLLYPSDHKLSEEAYERLKTIGEFTDLGSGFKIAMRDLEIRGAGSLLGAEQSGHIAAVGFDLYVEMVTEAVGELTDAPTVTCRRGADRPARHRAPAARLHRARRRADGGVPASGRGHELRRRRRRARRMDRSLRAAAAAGCGVARRRALASRVPAPRDPCGFGAEGPGPARRMGVAKVAGGAIATVVGTQPGGRRRGDRAGGRDGRCVAPAGTCSGCCARSLRPRRPRYAPPDETSPRVAPRALLCSRWSDRRVRARSPMPRPSTSRRRAPRTRFHVTRDDLLSEVGKLVANKPFAKWLKENKFAVNKNLSTDTKISAIWLSQLIRQQAIDSIFASNHLKVSSAQQGAGRQGRRCRHLPDRRRLPRVRREVPRRAGRPSGPGRGAARSYTDTSDAAGQKYFEEHEAQFACASGKDVSHILVATQAAAQKILDQITRRPGQAGRGVRRRSRSRSRPTRRAAPRAARSVASAPDEFVPAFQTAADAAPFDTPVGPVKSKFGYHVILVNHAVPSYEAARAAVQQALGQQGQLAAQSAIDALLKTFKVHLDPRFGTWGPATNGSGPERSTK